MTVTDPGHDRGALNVALTRIAGADPATSAKSPEILILLDWSDVAGTITGGYSRNTVDVGAAVAAKLADPTAIPTLGGALAQLPIDLIGHSRGASLVSQIANSLGRRGIWVDQMTTFDPVPLALYGDPVANVPQNVIFADNYYEQSDSIAVGKAIPGAYNVGPLYLPGGYVNFLGNGYHDNVHLYYQGTINLAAGAGDGVHTVNGAWYNAATRSGSGFYWSRLVGGTRPPGGVSTAFGGSAARVVVAQNLDSWANIGLINITSKTPAPVATGAPINVTFRYQDHKSASTVTWYLDIDENPYNGNETVITTQNLAKTARIMAGTAKLTIPAGLTDDTYHLLAVIADGNSQRMDYAGGTLTISSTGDKLQITAAAPTLAKTAGTITITGAPGGAHRSQLGNITTKLSSYSSLLSKIGLGNIASLGSLTNIIPSVIGGGGLGGINLNNLTKLLSLASNFKLPF
jgi:hypothetical protein